VTPWHHDQPYYCVEGQQSVSFWIPLDPVSRAVSLECIAGSHRWNAVGYRPRRFDGSRLYAEDRFEELPDIEAQRRELPVRSWDLEPGDAIAFDFRTIHGAPGNDTAVARRVFSARWVGADARFVARGSVGSPPFPHLALADGAPFDAPEFPVVFSRGLTEIAT
jgi:ectoine hydroxylase-related dioxygenase (phytanoyl-CoA dioxygenase family)